MKTAFNIFLFYTSTGKIWINYLYRTTDFYIITTHIMVKFTATEKVWLKMVKNTDSKKHRGHRKSLAEKKVQDTIV